MATKFKAYPLRLLAPSFDSPLTGLIMELDHLRKQQLDSTTPTYLFYQLKRLFHLFESVGSARIEGNNTTVAEYIETKIEGETASPRVDEGIQEIANIELAMGYIEEYIGSGYPINETFLKAIQQIIVQDLGREGDMYAGAYRPANVRIANSSHCPPESNLVPAYMEELFSFLRDDDSFQFDLIKVALAHHRLVWIHPFNNGNGRTVRLFTYALLLHYKFGVDIADRIVNPTAIFCSDRDRYYQMLSEADSGEEDKLLAWCEYVLSGLKVEIEKVKRLCDYDYVQRRILLPALDQALEREHITDMEHKILVIAVKKKELQSADLQELFEHKSAATRSAAIKKLVNQGMLCPFDNNKRKYYLQFQNNFLLRSIMQALDKEGFLPIN
ncbi:Fic family protein [Porphyromonas sp.]